MQPWTLISALVALFGVSNGMMINGAPQACLALDLSSGDLGSVGAGMGLGYGISCFILGRMISRTPAKYVLIGGVLASIATLIAMANSRTAGACVTVAILYGAATGAFWPFSSSWLMDFQSESVPKIKLLRFYNLSWTSGTAVGLYAGGRLADAGLVFQSFYIGAAICVVVVLMAACAPVPKHIDAGETFIVRRPLALPLLLAAVLANFLALGTRALMLNNYAELNKVYAVLNNVEKSAASRVGILTALTMVSQVAAFGFSRHFEHWLGGRRLYVVLGVSFAAINLIFAYVDNFGILCAAAVLTGIALAVAFQAAMLAATEYFSTSRAATTFHEAMIGLAGVYSLFAGLVSNYFKMTQMSEIQALRAPLIGMAVILIATSIIEVILVSMRSGERMLLSRQMPAAR